MNGKQGRLGLFTALILSTGLIASTGATWADDGNIGMFADAAATSTTAEVGCGASTTLWVYALLEGASASGMTGVEHSVDVTGAGGFLFSESPVSSTVQVGLAFPPATGMNKAWSTCQSGDGTKVLVEQVVATNIGCHAGETTLRVVQHQTPSNVFFRCPLFTLCDGPVFTKVCLGSDLHTCQTQVPPFPNASTCSTSGVFVLNPNPVVPLDINPGDEGASVINTASHGVITVAILGSDTLDVHDVDGTTLAFGPAGAGLAHHRGPHVEQVDDDGIDDLVAHFRQKETGIAPGDTEACITGELLDGTPFSGCDSVRTEPSGP